jgi:high potential iron-sulfur protein
VTRSEAIKRIVVLPALAGALAAGDELPASAASDNKKQFRYQDHPNSRNQKCSGCRFFRKPNACSIVHGTISPNGWCIAWVRR